LAVSLSASIAGAGLAFALAAIVSRALGAGGAGVYLQSVALFTIVATMLKLGADTGLVRAMSAALAVGRPQDVRPTLRIALVPVVVVSSCVAAGVSLAAGGIASNASGDPSNSADLAGSLVFLAPFLVASAILTVSLGALRGLGSVVGYSVILNLAVPLGRIVLVVAAIGAGLGAAGAVKGWALALPVWMVVALMMLRRAVRRHPAPPEDPSAHTSPGGRTPDDGGHSPGGDGTGTSRRDRTLERRFWSFSLGRWAAASVEIMLDWIDVLLVGALTDAATAGLYGIATRVVRAGQVVDNAMRVAVGPRISAQLALGDRAGLDRLVRSASLAMVALTLPFYLTCFVFAEPILSLFGPEFAAAAPALRILAVGMAVSAATVLLQSVVLMGGRSHWQLLNKVIALVVAIAANLVLIPVWGIRGAALSWVLAVLVDLVLVTVQTHRLTGVRPRPEELLPVVLVVGGSVALIGAMSRAVAGDARTALGIHLAVIAGLAVLGGLVWLVKVRVRAVRARPASAGAPLSGSPSLEDTGESFSTESRGR
jgi:O-antigen/teichoic acid export membrane protein